MRYIISAFLFIATGFGFAADNGIPEEDNGSLLREMAKRTFWEDRSISPDGYFILSKAYAETRVIDGLRKALDSRPKNSRFNCKSSLLAVEKGVSEGGHEQDTFFFRTDPDRKVLLSILDLSSSRGGFRVEEAYNEKVNGTRATISLVVDKRNPRNIGWGVGWDLAGGSAALYVENDGKSTISKDWVMRLAESIQCIKIKNDMILKGPTRNFSNET